MKLILQAIKSLLTEINKTIVANKGAFDAIVKTLRNDIDTNAANISKLFNNSSTLSTKLSNVELLANKAKPYFIRVTDSSALSTTDTTNYIYDALDNGRSVYIKDFIYLENNNLKTRLVPLVLYGSSGSGDTFTRTYTFICLDINENNELIYCKYIITYVGYHGAAELSYTETVIGSVQG